MHRNPQLPPGGDVRTELPALTGLRFVAAFVVLLAHASHTAIRFPGTTFWADFGSAIVWPGMSLFFVLSGFVIHYNYRRSFLEHPLPVATAGFAAARFARLYPLYLCGLLAALAMTPLESLLPTRADLFPFYLTLTQSWFFLAGENGTVWTQGCYPHAWSISTEAFFYLVYPAVVIPIARFGTVRGCLAALTGCSIAGYIASASAFISQDELARAIPPVWAGAVRPDGSAQPGFVLWISYYCPLMRFFEFVLGCLTAQLFLVVHWRPVGALAARVGAFGVLAGTGLIIALNLVVGPTSRADPASLIGFTERNFLYAPAIAGVLFCAVRYRSRASRWLNAKPVTRLGEASYSVYLIHPYVLLTFSRPDAPAVTDLAYVEWAARVAAGVVTSLVLAVGSYTVIENPARRVLRSFLCGPPNSVAGRPDRRALVRTTFAGAVLLAPFVGVGLGMWAYWKWHAPELISAPVVVKVPPGRPALPAAVRSLDPELADPGYPVGNLVDGSTATFWAAHSPAPARSRVELDLGTAAQVGRVELRPRPGYSQYFPPNVEVDGSPDGVTWSPLGRAAAFGLREGGGLAVDISTGPPRLRYVRVTATHCPYPSDADLQWYTLQLSEISVYPRE